MGWGPAAGYVFQKGFVEFFCEESDVAVIEEKIKNKGNGWVHYFAGNFKVCSFILILRLLSFRMIILSDQGDCRSNVSEDGRNAVTWGVFPGQEVVQTTIIERESFLLWKVSLVLRYTRTWYSQHKNRRKHFLYGPSGRCFIDLVLRREVSLKG